MLTYICLGRGSEEFSLPSKQQLQDALGETWNNITSIDRARSYGTINVHFRTQAKAENKQILCCTHLPINSSLNTLEKETLRSQSGTLTEISPPGWSTALWNNMGRW